MSKQDEANERFAKWVRGHLRPGMKTKILGREVNIIRVGYYGGDWFPGGVVFGYWDDNGVWRKEYVCPAEVPGTFTLGEYLDE